MPSSLRDPSAVGAPPLQCTRLSLAASVCGGAGGAVPTRCPLRTTSSGRQWAVALRRPSGAHVTEVPWVPDVHRAQSTELDEGKGPLCGVCSGVTLFGLDGAEPSQGWASKLKTAALVRAVATPQPSPTAVSDSPTLPSSPTVGNAHNRGDKSGSPTAPPALPRFLGTGPIAVPLALALSELKVTAAAPALGSWNAPLVGPGALLPPGCTTTLPEAPYPP